MTVTINLSGRNALVTGAGKGIGREVCVHLAQAGASVFGVSRTEADLLSLGEKVRALGVGYGFAVADLRGPSETGPMAAAAQRALGDIHILVNNAGVGSRNVPAHEMGEAQWDETLDINVKAAFFLAQAVGAGMVARRYGRIVNMSSQAGVVAIPNHVAYSASKAAMNLMTKALALEWGQYGVTVNAVAPTFITLPGGRTAGTPELIAQRVAQVPIGRYGTPAEVARLVVYLASDGAALINGEVVVIDGGYTIH